MLNTIRLLIFVIFLLKVSPEVHFKRIICNSIDPITVIEKCHIGIVNKSITALTLYEKLPQPIYSVYANITVIQLSNSMNRMLYKLTNVDVCSFLLKRRNPVLKFLFSIVQKYSNVNHSCPYKDYLIFKELVVNDPKLARMPYISGEYEIQTSWLLNGKNASQVKVIFRYNK